MLNPQSEHIIAAAAEMDRIRFVAHKMSVACSEKRRILFRFTKLPVDALLALNREHFANSETIRGRIAMLAKALLTLRNLGDGKIDEDRSDGRGNCPYCATPIKRFQPDSKTTSDDPWLIYCPQCSEIYGRALQRLSVAGVGFGTDAI